MSPFTNVARISLPAIAPDVAAVRTDAAGFLARPRLASSANGNQMKLDETLGQITVAVVECPFCGSDELKVVEHHGATRISCCRCHSAGPVARSACDAIEHSGWLHADMSTGCVHE